MAELPTHPDTDDDLDGGTDRRSASGGPRWKSVVAVVAAAAVIALFVVLHLTGVVGPADH